MGDLMEQQEWETFDWNAIVPKLPKEEWGQAPFVADNRLLYLLVRDNRESYLKVGDFSGPIIDTYSPQARWNIVTNIRTLVGFLKEKGYAKDLPSWMDKYEPRWPNKPVPGIEFPRRLAFLMKKHRTSTAELAAFVRVERQSISKYLNTESPTFPTIDKLNSIANYFRVSADYLLGRSDE